MDRKNILIGHKMADDDYNEWTAIAVWKHRPV